MQNEHQYSKKFLKQLSKIPFDTRKKIEDFVFVEILSITHFENSGKIEKMKGYKNYYKIRFGAYRVGIHAIGNNLIFKIVLHRKDIYNYFP